MRNSLIYNYKTALGPNNSISTIKNILIIYKNNFQNKKIKNLTIYNILDLNVL